MLKILLRTNSHQNDDFSTLKIQCLKMRYLLSFFQATLPDTQIRIHTKSVFSYFSTKTYVMGTQKNCHIETGLLSTQNTCLT